MDAKSYALYEEESDKKHPFAKAGLLSRVSFEWITSLMVLGAKQPLMADDVWDLGHEETCRGIYDRFAGIWATSQGTARIPRFNIALVRTFYVELLVGLLSLGSLTVCQVIQPLVLQSVLQYLQDQPISFGISNGYVLMAMLAIATFLQGIFLNYGFFVSSKIGVNMRSITMDMVYQKALKLSSSARQLTTSGEIVTLMSSDSERICEAANEGLWLIISPFTFVCSMVLVGTSFGVWPALSGAAMTVIVLYGSSLFASSIGKTRLDVTSVTEERVKVTSEILQGIRVMKFYAWEPAVTQRLESLRQNETALLRHLNLFRVLNVEFLFLSPIFVGAAVLSTYIGLGNTFGSTDIFTLIAFVNMSRQALYNFPRAIAGLSEGIGAGGRLDAYLDLEEQEPTENSSLQTQVDGSVTFEDASFSWKADSAPCLDHLNLKITPGSLVMIVGSVGSGKSSLLSAILGEMHQVAGSISAEGTLALVSQEPWIRNASIRDNILFEDDYDSQWYKSVIRAVQLETDLHLLPAGDRTEIGEQGINLSGGQKARVNLARAIYKRNSTILLLDDPLSAVDVNVAKAIFEQAIQGIAANQTRIMAMNSHYHFLRHADRILVMENGVIVGDGTYAELYSSFPQFLNRPVEHEAHDNVVPIPSIPIDMDRRLSEVSTVADEKDAVLIIEEDRAKGTVRQQTYTDYFGHVGFNGWLVTFSLVFMFGVGQGVRISVDWWQGYWAARYLTSSVSVSHGIFYALVVSTALFFFARCCLLVTYTSRCSENMHNQLLQCVLRAPVNLFFDVTPVGRILNRFARDLDIVDSVLPNLFLDILETMFVVVGALSVCASSSVYVALSYLPVMLLFHFAGQFFKKSSRELKRLEGVSRSPIFSSFAETLDGIQTIRAFRMQKHFTNENRRVVDANAKFLFALVGAGRWLSIRMDTAATVLIAVILIVLISLKGVISSTIAGLTLIYSLALLSTVQWVIRLFDMLESAMTAVERLLHFKTIPSEAASTTAVDPTHAWPTNGAIQFDSVKLRYRPDLPLVLHGVSLDIRGGEKVGICGRTGAGKSSLMIALFRISELDEGVIRIDGVNTSSIGLSTLRRALSIIPQDPVLFSGTLRDNLDPFKEKSDEELTSVLRQTHLDLPLSLTVAEYGSNLSVGQRQLLCIGRALLRQSRIIVMDEATANVDLATDRLIQSTIQEAFTHETVLTIAHRLDTILHCDRVVVLDKGCVVEFDAPGKLMADSTSQFHDLAKQAGVLKPVHPST